MDVNVVEHEITSIQHEKGKIKNLEFKDGSNTSLEALYARPPFVQHSDIPQRLGCKLTDSGHIEIDEFHQTTITGIYAAGDNSVWLRAVSIATAAGTKAGAFINHALIQEKSYP